MSMFANARSPTPLPETISFEDFLLGIKNGRWAQEVAQARAGGTEGPEWKERKRGLPGVTMSSTVSHRSAKGLKEPSGWLQIDLDAKDNPGVDWEDIRRRLIDVLYIGGGATGPSGTGLKLGLRIDPAYHSASFEEAEKYFRDKYGLKIDPACSDPARLCFVSHDPEAWCHTERETLVFPIPADSRPGIWTRARAHGPAPVSVTFKSEEEEAAVVRGVEEMLKYIPTRPDYLDWLKILSAVFSVLPFDSGSRCLEAWSPEEVEEEYREKFEDRLSDVRLGTLIRYAQQGGYKISPEVRQRHAISQLPDLTTPPETGNILEFPEDVTDIVEPNDFVENLLTDGTLSMVFGPSGVGKSFFVLDLAVHVARGQRWRNGEVEIEGGAVLYFALEGSHGARQRVKALKQQGLLADGVPFALCFCPVDLLRPGGTEWIKRAVEEFERRRGARVRLIILDTLSRSMGGGNENDNDMTKAIMAIDAIRTDSGAHVMLIHHSGKDVERGARGHSSLRAAVDTEIEIFRVEGSDIITAIVKKQRDLETRAPMPFKLDKVAIGIGRRDKALTSCICRHLPPDEALKWSGKKREPKFEWGTVLGLLPRASIPAWRKEAKARLNISRSTFDRYLDSAAAKGTWTQAEDGTVERVAADLEE